MAFILMASSSGCANGHESLALHRNLPICAGFGIVGGYDVENYRERRKSSTGFKVGMIHIHCSLVGCLPGFER